MLDSSVAMTVGFRQLNSRKVVVEGKRKKREEGDDDGLEIRKRTRLRFACVRQNK